MQYNVLNFSNMKVFLRRNFTTSSTFVKRVSNPSKVSLLLTKEHRATLVEQSKQSLNELKRIPIPEKVSLAFHPVVINNPMHIFQQNLLTFGEEVLDLSKQLDGLELHKKIYEKTIVGYGRFKGSIDSLRDDLKHLKFKCGYNNVDSEKNEDIADIIHKNMNPEMYGSVFKDIDFGPIATLQSELHFFSNSTFVSSIDYIKNWYEKDVLGRPVRSPEESYALYCSGAKHEQKGCVELMMHYSYDADNIRHYHPRISRFCDAHGVSDHSQMRHYDAESYGVTNGRLIGLSNPFKDSIATMIDNFEVYVRDLKLEFKHDDQFIGTCKTLASNANANKNGIKSSENMLQLLTTMKDFDKEIYELRNRVTSDNYFNCYNIFLHNLNCVRFGIVRHMMGINNV